MGVRTPTPGSCGTEQPAADQGTHDGGSVRVAHEIHHRGSQQAETGRPAGQADGVVQPHGPPWCCAFYYVGHGQPDDNDRLCLGLVDSRTEAERRATTSLRFGDVRDALRRSPAETKVLVLDCCFAGLATSPHTLAAGTFEGMVRGSGAYTMAASGPYNTAWFEATEASPRPQTFFTKYLADVIEEGIAGQPPGLTLHEI